MTRIALIANPKSGRAKPSASGAARRAGAEVETFASAKPSRPDIGAGAERIAVAGGDGSIGAAAALAAAAGIPLAVIPTGTANDFATHFGLPSSSAAACRLAAGGTGTRSSRAAARLRPAVRQRRRRRAAAGRGGGGRRAQGGPRRRSPIRPARSERDSTSDPIRCAVRVDGERVFAGEAWQVSVAEQRRLRRRRRLSDRLRRRQARRDRDRGRQQGPARQACARAPARRRRGQTRRRLGAAAGRSDSSSIPERSLNVDGELVDVAAARRRGRLASRPAASGSS